MKKMLVFLFAVFVLMLMMSTVAFAADGAEEVEADNFLTYIVEKAYVLIPVLYLIGLFIKKIPKIPDWIIPLVLLVLGVVAAMAIIGWSIDGAIQGVLVAGATVFVNQAYKQLFVKSKSEG